MASSPAKGKQRRGRKSADTKFRQPTIKDALGIPPSHTPPKTPATVVPPPVPKQQPKPKEKKHQGRPTQFTEEEYAWIRATLTEFDDMVLNRTGEVGIKARIKAWKEEKWNQIVHEHGASLARVGDWQHVSVISPHHLSL